MAIRGSDGSAEATPFVTFAVVRMAGSMRMEEMFVKVIELYAGRSYSSEK